jgi:Predicted membrane protein
MGTYAPAKTIKYCEGCGGIMALETETCPHCLAVQSYAGGPGVSDKKRMPTFILAVFLGVFGVHRFYVGKTTSAIVQLLTLGGLGIWALADMIIIAFGGFTDGDGREITEWT